ncbi:MAG TPA: 3-isopropylmalate dehydrogenase [Syntrophothermus lipocalidus]|nr:3-isopropylmalate dehydrogenase [Syntrophothermus lipocalidus]
MLKIAVLPGDGIGTEIVPEAVKVLKAVAARFNHEFVFTQALVGGAAIDEMGVPLPEETLALCKASDAVLLGAIGGPKWDNLPAELRPEAAALLPLRKELGLYANLRPAYLFPELIHASSLKPEVIEGVDLLVVRELTGGLYFGEKRREKLGDGERAVDVLEYTTYEIERIVRLACEAARKRRKRVTSVDKANVLESSRLWREVAGRVALEYPDIELSHMYVDNCAMQLIRNPRQFDVIVTENMFGDILTDEASMLTGSLGMLPSASIGGKVGLYEPSHGSAPDIAGQGKANPLATILSAAMMLRYSFQLEQEALAVEKAVREVLAGGYRTPDIAEPGQKLVSTREMGDLVASKVEEVEV